MSSDRPCTLDLPAHPFRGRLERMDDRLLEDVHENEDGENEQDEREFHYRPNFSARRKGVQSITYASSRA
jgi:hypothetical protein